MTSNIKIIAARANSAKLIKEFLPHINVIEIPITGYDVMRSLHSAKFHGKTIALITTIDDIYGLKTFEEIFNIKILNYLATPYDNFNNIIQDAISHGAEIILGGALTCKSAERLGFRSTVLKLGPESINTAIKSIRDIEESLKLESKRQGFITKLIDNIVEGVILLDDAQNIILINSIAKRIIKLKETDPDIIGTHIKEVIPDFIDNESFSSKENISDYITSINDVSIICNNLPIKMDDNFFGSIVTFHEANKIQKMEKAVRNKLYEKTHFAKYEFDNIIGESDELKTTISNAKAYAITKSNILICGETGTGKELFAQSIHNQSNRKNGPFVAINCAALPDNLLESELFGYVEGAFTGARSKGKAGVFEIAHQGTIFLDEISGMSYDNQSSLLRVLEEKYVVRLGSNKKIPVDVRIITASNENLKDLIEENKFRKDLYYRLNVLNLTLPSLRFRKSDIIILINLFLNNSQSQFKNDFILENDTIELLKNYDWPGNVRELRNISERIVAISKSPVISKNFIENMIRLGNLPQDQTNIYMPEEGYALKEQIQIDEINRALKNTSGNMTEAAEILKISRSTLWRRLKKYNLN